MVSPSGSVFWSYRNMVPITKGDKFSYEIRAEFAPGNRTQVGKDEVRYIEMVYVASCANRTAQTTSDSVFGAKSKLLTSNILVDKEPIVPKDGTADDLILKMVCGAKPAKKIQRPTVSV